MEVRRDLEADGFLDFDSFVRLDRGSIVHGSSQTTNRRVPIQIAGIHGHAYLKVYDFKGRSWRDRLRRAKPLIEAANYEHMGRIGIGVPHVLAFGCRRRFGRLVDGFIFTREIPDSVTLEAYFETIDSRHAERSSESVRSQIVSNLARTVARMHAANFFHIDLQWRNILVSRSDISDRDIYILDCVRGGRRIHPLMRRHGMLRDLASLYKDARRFLRASEQVRWLRQYFGVARLTETHRAIIQSILRDREIKSPERSR